MLAINEPFFFSIIIVIQKKMAIGDLSISSRSTDFLNIIFDSFWHVHMDNCSNIFFIDTHAKSDSSNNHSEFVRKKVFVNLLFLGLKKITMICASFYIVIAKIFSHSEG